MIREFLSRGHRVIAIGSEEIPHVREALEGWGARYVVVPLRRAGLNPVADLGAVLSLYRTLRGLRADLVLAYTAKPVVYGMPTAWAAGIKRRYAMITGRGYAFQPGREWSRRVARLFAGLMYRYGLRFADGVLFHNNDDRELFVREALVGPQTRTCRIWGSGIDLAQYQPEPLSRGPVRFLMVGRLIIDKGVREFVAAAERIKAKFPDVEFRLVGPTDPSPNGISEEEIRRWKQAGVVDYIGAVRDVRPELADCHVLVLPSYAEGLPRSVLEAMAAERAIITTDAPGCADTVEDGVSGYLVPARNAEALAKAMERVIAHPEFMISAGSAGLALARQRFDVDKVNADICDFLDISDLHS
ncbi:MAG: glycosyltransferase family 4 protein [Sphingomonas sp.]